MKHLLLLLLFALCSSISLLSQDNKQFAVYFETAEATISVEANAELTAVAKYLRQLNDYTLLIEAHTDDRGTVQYNEDLAQRRAASVQQFLENQGLLIEKTTVRSFGEVNPAFPNVDDQGRQSNRRVDILVESAIGALTSLDELLTHLGKGQVQHFKFNANQAVKITAENGTTFWIEKNAFQFADGSMPDGEIDFAVREAYSYMDMLAEGLSTTSGSELLETGGMLRLEASANGQPLQLKGDQEIAVAMPTLDTKDGMQLFTGQAVAENQPFNWLPTGQEFTTGRKVSMKMPPRPRMPVNRYATSTTPTGIVKPTPPREPKAPYEPHEPKRSQIKYNPGFFKRMVMGKKRIEEKENEIFATKMEEYQAKMTNYRGEMALYKKDLEKYEQAKVNYPNELAAYKREVREKRQEYLESEEYKRKEEALRQNYEHQLAIYQKKMQAWEALRLQKLEEFEASYEQVGATDANSLNYYFYNVNQMGWINCDRFRSVPSEEKLMVSIQDVPGEEKTMIIFRDMDSIIQPVLKGDVYTSSNLPKGRDITIMSIKLVNGRTFLALKDTQVGAEERYQLQYEPATLRDIREALAKNS